MVGAGVYMQQANMETLSVSGIAHIGDRIQLKEESMGDERKNPQKMWIFHNPYIPCICYIYLHLVADFDAKCGFIFHTWMLWVIFLGKLHRDQFPPVGKTPYSSGRVVSPSKCPNNSLGGGFKHFLCSPLFGEDSHFDEYFQMGWFNHQLVQVSEFYGNLTIYNICYQFASPHFPL